MNSQSSYVYNESPNGLGLMAYDDQMILQPVDHYTSGGSAINAPTVIKPIISTTSVPQTGGSSPIVNPVSKPANEIDTDSNSIGSNRPPFVRVEGDQFVINGTHRVPKKQAAIIGGGAIGAALLLKFIL